MDTHILEELYKQHVTNLSQVVNGAKILSVDIPNVKFIDSMNFFPMAPSNFPKTFGIQELKKENQNYVGYMPDKSCYDPDGMSPSRKQEFLAWHESISEVHFWFSTWTFDLLSIGCATPQKGMYDFSIPIQRDFKLQPYARMYHYCICLQCRLPKEMDAWRRDCCGTGTWVGSHTQSVSCRLGMTLTHGRQHFLVDGYDEQTRSVYEFQGCFFHGCLRCFPNRSKKHLIHLNKTMYDVREETRNKINRLTDSGYRIYEMWECEWNQSTILKWNSLSINSTLLHLSTRAKLFFGGRTNAIKLHHRIEVDEQNYYDMTLLYPCANLECKYPVGHPEFIDQPDTTDISKFYGLVKCKIYPPYGLYHPVLPYRHESKLSFPLCKRVCNIFKNEIHNVIIPQKNVRLLEHGPLYNLKKQSKRGTSSLISMKCGISKNKSTNFSNLT